MYNNDNTTGVKNPHPHTINNREAKKNACKDGLVYVIFLEYDSIDSFMLVIHYDSHIFTTNQTT